ncbi:LOW QUALITY PROTEIN: proenkephalin a [Clupea harengus]|uniref:LOW QUALITY PROTEIN: proenkephalin a n=1 Tax=Clupea harengus TaxID=7950 RepID=A0A6P8EXV1_CLUHA|nr:LOW QUALITY PROTEIN: proenkephalin a [Clupea harengus]
MAVTVNLFRILAVFSCLALTAATECREDCALCVYRRLLDGGIKASSLSCTLECEGSVDDQKLEKCRSVLTEVEATDSPLQGKEDEAQQQQHQLAKKYGGFMKRYNGFLMKKTAGLGDDTGAPFDGEAPDLMSKRYGGFMKKDTAARQEIGEARQLQALREILDAQRSEGGSKHYDGFMRRPQESQEDAVQDLQKRYGGFMRRVGRPEWLDDHDQRVHGGLTKRFLEKTADTSVPNMEKRYGDFMD